MNRQLIFKLYKEKYSTEPDSAIEQFVEQHIKSLKKETEPKIRISYSDQHLENDELNEIVAAIEDNEIKVETYDTSRQLTANYFDPSWMEIILNSEIVRDLLVGVGSSFITIILTNLHAKLKHKTVKYTNGVKTFEKPAKLKIRLKDPNGREYTFYIEDTLSDESKKLAIASIEKMILDKAIKEDTPLKNDYKYTQQQWESINMLEEMKRNMERQKNLDLKTKDRDQTHNL